VQRQAPQALLDTYQVERKPLALRNTAYARHFADSVGLFRAKPELEESSPDGERERALASEYLNRHARLEFNIPGVTFGGRYDASPVIARDGSTPPADSPNDYVPTASPGGRPPHAWLDDGRSLYDLFGRDWTLLVLGDAPPDTEPLEAVARELGLDLQVVRLGSASIRALYEAPLALIRPDQIVAWRGSSADGATAILDQVTGRELASSAGERTFIR
jgi:hypothetical protein